MNQETSNKVQEAMNFLTSHPALNCDHGDFFSANLTWWINDYCKNGQIKDQWEKPDKMQIRVFQGDEDGFYEKYYGKYADEDNDPNDKYDDFYVPYMEIYGEHWKYDKTLYGADFSWFAYHPRSDAPPHGRYQYNAYQGKYLKANNWEELIIKIADEAKKVYGDYEDESFLTKKEKENHAKYSAFNHVPVEDDENGRKLYSLTNNENYIEVTHGQLNLRWLDWFKTTDYFKKNWLKNFSYDV